MKEGYYLIGEVSKITGISKDTLHFYNKCGLLVPDTVDESNQYRYYSRFNLWQLDIITACRKLSIPLNKVKQLLALHDNEKVTELLLEYRSEALRLSRYFKQVAEDISWYDAEAKRIDQMAVTDEVQLQILEAETVITGLPEWDPDSYHANLQKAAREELHQQETIRRKYGYFLDPAKIQEGCFYKYREYLKIKGSHYPNTDPECLHVMPAGEYAVCLIHIKNSKSDFTPLLDWLSANKRQIQTLYAEEAGMQLFDYIDDFYCELKAYLVPSLI